MATIEQNLLQLVQDRDDLVDNLETMGISGLTGNETITELVPEVLNISGGGGHNGSLLGYSDEPQYIKDGYDYALQGKRNGPTNYQKKFNNDRNLVYMPMVDMSNRTDFSQTIYNCPYVAYVPLLDTSNGTNFDSMFQGCSSLQTIPLLDTSNGTTFKSMFFNCFSLGTIPQINTSKGTNFQFMFDQCYHLQTIAQIDTSKGTNLYAMFRGCIDLTTVPELDASSAEDIREMFSGIGIITFKNFGGLKNLGKAYLTTASANYSNYTLSLSRYTNLTYDSLMNVINNLYDIASKGVQPQQLQLGSTNLAKLSSAEIAIATNKGGVVS